MRRTYRLALVPFLALLLVGLAACGGGGGGGGGIPLLQSTLTQALSYAPANTDSVYFTNWTLLKQYQGATTITSKSDYQTRLNFYVAVSRAQGIASFFNASSIVEQDWATLWGWDTSDLLWEATLNGQFPPVYVLKVRSDLDLSPVMAHFTSRGFSSRTYQGATVYSHLIDLTVDWFTDPAIFNAAVIPSDHVIIVGGGPNGIDPVLDAHATTSASLAGDGSFQALAARMGAPAAAILASPTNICSQFGQVGDQTVASQNRSLLAAAGPLHTYSALGIGYTSAQGRADGLIILNYTSSQNAQADLNARQSLAANGLTTLDGKAYSQALFTVDAASVSGGDLTMTVTPLNNRPQVLFDMFDARDLLFAACP